MSTPSRPLPAALLALAVAACSASYTDDPATDAEQQVASTAGAKLSVCWVETAHHDVPYYGAVTGSGMLVRHPKGDLLVDGGASTHYEDEIRPYSGGERLFFETIPSMMKPTTPLPEALRAMGVRPEAIRAFLPSHIHVDHVGGMMDMPDLPVLLAPAEADLVRRGVTETLFEVPPAHAARLRPLVKPIAFAPRAYEGFAESFDVFGDGAVVVVPLPGHTPGSVGVFVTGVGGSRLFHVGDTVSTLKQVETGDPKSWPMSRTDSDPVETLERVHELHALKQRSPDIRIVPGHDRSAWVSVFGQPGACVEAKRQ